ncbi:hypothetical protein D3C78_1004980 [compost metagenome]
MAEAPLTNEQKKALSILEPKLKSASERRDLEEAKRITLEIQNLLRPTGHENRLMFAKNFLFETAMEAGKIDFAIQGLTSIKNKTSSTTRLHLEATTLLAICHLRRKNLDAAKPYMIEALKYEKNIKSPTQRTEFKIALTKRFDEEALLSSLTTDTKITQNLNQIQSDAGDIIRTKHEDEILELLGSSVPGGAFEFVEKVHTESIKCLTYEEKLRLPSPASFEQKQKIGKGVLSAFQSVIYKSLCDKESEIYKMWFTNGMQAVLDKKYLTGAVVSALSGLSIGTYAIAVYLTALLIKIGIEVFCETHKNQGIMSLRRKRA